MWLTKLREVNTWMAAGLAVVALILSIYAYGQQQYRRGEVACAVPHLKRANADLAEANDLIIKLQREARDTELAHAARLAELDKSYQEKQAHEQAKNDVVVRNLRAGIAKLQYRAQPASSQQAGANTASAVGASPSGGDAAATSELPSTLAGDLYDLAARADEITEQLTACQQVIVEDRRVCGLDSLTE